MNKITEFTISLHCGCDREVVNNQMRALKPLEVDYNVHWNNRIDRYPKLYPSYSQLMNHAIATSPTEWVILINDRTYPTVDEVKKMISLLESGFSCVYLYNVGFVGFSKELIRKIGWWDERFDLGGWEDRDWVFRLKMHNLAFYESLESTYDMSWKSPLNGPPGDNESRPHWEKKYDTISYNDVIWKHLPEESYPHWDLFLGDFKPEISESWKNWNESILDIMYNQKDRPGCGPSGSSMASNRIILESYKQS
jgi:hypothetical protein